MTANGDILEHASALRKEGRLVEAMALFREAARRDPLNPAVWGAAARTALDARDWTTAAGLLSTAVRFAPGDARGWHDLGFALFRLGRYDEAAAAYERAAALRPDDMTVLVGLGQMYYLLGRDADAEAAHDRALAAPCERPKERQQRAIVRLVRGDFVGGWEDHAARWERKKGGNAASGWRPRPDQLWTGEPLADDERVCVYANDGAGDTFLFARYLRLVAERSGRPVVAAMQRSAERLIAPLPWVAEYRDHPEGLPEGSRFADIWSLPRIFRTTIETIPSEVPYLHLPAEGPMLPGAAGRLRVGLVWAGGAGTPHDADRSAPSATVFAPLLALPGIDWWSLQVGEREEEAEALAASVGVPVRRCPPVRDFADTAFVLAQLDLLISVDTGIANLAGAIGRPVWNLIPTFPEFRWMLRREDSPWYPTMRLFRRRHTRDWDGVVARIAEALRTFAPPARTSAPATA